MRSYVRSLFFVALAVAIVAPGALGQSLLSSQGQVLAPSGAAAPGLSGELFGNSFDNGVMDDAGNILFRVQLTDSLGAALPNTVNRALYVADPAGNLTLVVRSGDPEPTGTISGGANLQTATGTGPGGSYRISANGVMLWGSSMVGSLINSTNDTAMFVGTPGNWSVLVREGDPAPGTVGATYSSSFSSPSQQNTALNAAAQVLFKSSLLGGDVSGTTNNDAWFTGTVGMPLGIMVRKGDTWGPGGEVVSALGFASQMNASGQILYDVTYLTGSGTTPVTASDNVALFLYTPGFGSQQIWREGSASPIAGANYSGSVNIGSSAFNAAGHALLRCDLTGAVTAGVDDSALVDVSASGHTVVVRRGDVLDPVNLPGVTVQVMHNTNLHLGDSGWIAFNCSLSDGGVSITTANDESIWAGTPGNFKLVAREGDVAPGTGGGTFGSSLMSMTSFNNGNGQLLFNASIVGGTSPGSSLWSWDPVVGLQAVVLSGESIQVMPGVFQTTTTSGGVQFNNGDTRALSFAKDGTATWRQSFAGPGGSPPSAIVKVRIATLTGTPGTISQSAGGLQNLYLNAGAAHAGQTYVVIGSASGTMPGVQFGPFLVPLNFDAYTEFTLVNANVGPYVNTFGVLDANGRATAGILLPGGLTGVAGVVVHHAYGVLDGLNNLVFVSEEAARLEITP